MKCGIVLEGGALRGMYTAGVLDTLLENDIQADLVVGVSAGALFGVNYVSKQKGRAIRYNKRFNSDPKYMGLYSLVKEGNLVNTEYAYERVPHELDPFDDETYKRNPTKFYAVITNIKTGKPEYVHVQSVFEQMDVLRASGSMPFVSKPVEINGNHYLDGAIGDNIPFEWMASQEMDKIIVILTRDSSYRKKAMSKWFTNLYKNKYPKISQGLERRHELYNHQIDLLRKWEEQGKVFVFRPSSPIQIGRIERDPDKLQAVYDLGCKDGKAQLQRLRRYLEK
ncbi:MAG: patatin family protein [Bacillota bacterium]|nr:patatin family protein [Bacillota bacterium]